MLLKNENLLVADQFFLLYLSLFFLDLYWWWYTHMILRTSYDDILLWWYIQMILRTFYDDDILLWWYIHMILRTFYDDDILLWWYIHMILRTSKLKINVFESKMSRTKRSYESWPIILSYISSISSISWYFG